MTGRNTAGINNEIMITMKYRFFILGLAAALFTACAVNEADHSTPAFNDGEEFYATIEGAATKVYVDEDLKVLWHADDRVSIFNKYTYNQQYRFTGNTGANSGSFQKVPNEDFITGNALDYVYAVYPYQEVTEISNQGLLTVELPATQSYAEDSFGVGANTMVSCSEGNELLFKNLCGYIMLKLYGDDVTVTSISIKGNSNEPLAGKATVNASVDGDPSLSFDSSATNEITLTFDTPVALGTTAETTTTFWLVIPPTVFEAGITLTVETSDGGVFEKRTTGSLVLSRNTRSTMAALKVIPEPSVRYLTFTSDGTTTLSLTNFDGHAPVLYYSTDRANWTLWDYSELTFTSYMPLYLCGDNPEGFCARTGHRVPYSTFISNGSNFQVSGDIMSLIDKNEVVRAIPSAYCFRRLFRECRGLTKAPELPATTLANYCYLEMFNGCSSLTTAPVLPATTLAYRCYQSMFYGCSSLTTAPELPATTLEEGCYNGMFMGCTSLTNAPELPATTLASDCYYQMFSGCTGLTTAPDLPATTLAPGCYQSMFNGCTSLTTAPELPATTLAGVCYYRMFYGCTQLNYVKCLATDINASSCVSEWLSNVASTGTFVKAAGMNNWPRSTSGIPSGWTVVSCPEAVDLGLSVKWASFNLGASKPEEYGDYYAWGETEPYYEEGYGQENPCTHWRSRMEPAITGYNWASYKWCMGSQKTKTKYCTNSSYGYNGFMDGKTVLDPEDDAAHVALVGNWRMPTDSEWTELRDNCTWEWTDNYNETGVAGRIVTSNVEGYKDKSIFLPAAGRRHKTYLYTAGFEGYYWSSSLDSDFPDNAWFVVFGFDLVYWNIDDRSYGQSVRPVYAE